MFEEAEEDNSFSFSVPNSNLSSLFGQTMKQSTPHSNHSNQMFKAPKQPTVKVDESLKPKTEPSSAIILFKEVKAFKVIEDKNILQGSCGLAIIGNDNNSFHLLLYKHQNDIISTVRLHRYLEFTVEHDNYTSYCDDNKSHWRVHFSTEADALEFSNALKIRKVKILKSDKKPCVIKKPSNEFYVGSEGQSGRMAKMGEKMKAGDYGKTSSESDSDEVVRPSLSNRNCKKGQSAPSNGNDKVPQSPGKVCNQHLIMNGQYYPLPQPQVTSAPALGSHHTMLPLESSSPIVYAPPHFISEQLNVFFAENRTHNAEVRMNVVRLTSKMEEMLDKLTRLDQRPVQANRHTDKLRATVMQQKEIIEEMQRKYKNETKTKKTELSESAKEHDEKNLEHLELINKLQSELSEQNKIIEEMKNAKLEKFVGIDEKLKKSMNELYHSIASDVKDDNTYLGNELKSILASRIRQYTYYIVSLLEDLNSPKVKLNNVSVEIEE